MKKFISFILTAFIVTVICNAQTEPPFHQEGIASWYGTEFDGMPTASEEIFDSSQFTAAHPKLPFGTLLIVTNQLNNKKVAVRINDRGPFIPGRIIDLSKAAAEQIDMISSNTAQVILDTAPKGTPLGAVTTTVAQTPTVPPATLPASPPPKLVTPQTPPQTVIPPITPQTPPISAKPADIKPSLPLPGTNKKYRLQVGAYSVPKNAVDAVNKLKNVGLSPSYERYEDKATGKQLYRVVLSGVKADDVKSAAEKIGQAGFSEALIREEP